MTPQSTCNAPFRPCSTPTQAVAGVGRGGAEKSAQRAVDAPTDLLAWVGTVSTQRAARVLAVDGGRIRQFRRGVHLRISLALLARWEAHKAQLPAMPWQLRRVGRGGMVVLAGQRWQLPAALVPQRAQVLVSLSQQGALLVRLADGPVMVSIEAVCAT
jgi:hypothetical protein